MPFLLQRTSYIWTASDPALASLNGDDPLPDLAIGRLPATTLEQAHTLVAKVLEHARNNGLIADAGAVTWGSGVSGVAGAVSSTNSLVGTTAIDRVGAGGVAVLTNGNYVVWGRDWDDGAVTDAGAATGRAKC